MRGVWLATDVWRNATQCNASRLAAQGRLMVMLPARASLVLARPCCMSRLLCNILGGSCMHDKINASAGCIARGPTVERRHAAAPHTCAATAAPGQPGQPASLHLHFLNAEAIKCTLLAPPCSAPLCVGSSPSNGLARQCTHQVYLREGGPVERRRRRRQSPWPRGGAAWRTPQVMLVPALAPCAQQRHTARQETGRMQLEFKQAKHHQATQQTGAN